MGPWDPAAWEAVKLEPAAGLRVAKTQDRDRAAAGGSVQLDLLDGSGA
jgi:hypothetical protein